jgi:hypothetical protein
MSVNNHHLAMVPDYSVKFIGFNCTSDIPLSFRRWNLIGRKNGGTRSDLKPFQIALKMLSKKMDELTHCESYGTHESKNDANIDADHRKHTILLLNHLYMRVQAQIDQYVYALKASQLASEKFVYQAEDFERHPLVLIEAQLKVFFYHNNDETFMDWIRGDVGITDPVEYWTNEFKNNQNSPVENIEMIYPISDDNLKICKHVNTPTLIGDSRIKKELRQIEEGKASLMRMEKEELEQTRKYNEEKRAQAAAEAAAKAAAAAEAKEKSWLNRLLRGYEQMRKIPPMGVMGGKSKRIKRVKRSSRVKAKRNSTKRRKH